jgi:hypothetical protein
MTRKILYFTIFKPINYKVILPKPNADSEEISAAVTSQVVQMHKL